MGTFYEQLSLDDRCAIAGLRADGHSIRQIATRVDRSASTISRELKRNSGVQVGYKPAYAHEQARARRWRGSRMARQPALCQFVLDRLAMGWSPEQVAGRLARDKSSMRISHESIYRFIHAQIRRTKRYEWRHYLPQAKSRRGWGRRPHRPIEHIKDRVSIDCRPAHVDTRRQCGHWEADLLHPRKSGAAVLVAQERTTRYILLARQPGKHAQPIVDRIKLWFAELPAELRRVSHPGQRAGVLRAPPTQPHRRQNLLLPSAQPMAEGRHRKHQRPPPTLHPARHRPRQLLRRRSATPRLPPQQHAAQMPRLQNPRRSLLKPNVALEM
jgi:IS30 family transposase